MSAILLTPPAVPALTGFKRLHGAAVFSQAAVDFDDHREIAYMSEDVPTRSHFAVKVSGDPTYIVTASLPAAERQALIRKERGRHIALARGSSSVLNGYLLSLPPDEYGPIVEGKVPLHVIDAAAASWSQTRTQVVARIKNAAKARTRAAVRALTVDAGDGETDRPIVPKYMVVKETGEIALFRSRPAAKRWAGNGMAFIADLDNDKIGYVYLEPEEVDRRIAAEDATAPPAAAQAAPAEPTPAPAAATIAPPEVDPAAEPQAAAKPAKGKPAWVE